jgi:hypothetical protein
VRGTARSELGPPKIREQSRRDPHALLRLGQDQQVRVTCNECGWQSRWLGTLDLAWTAFKAHERVKHRSSAS